MATKDAILDLLAAGKLEEAEEAWRVTTELSGDETNEVEAALAEARSAPPAEPKPKAEAPKATSTASSTSTSGSTVGSSKK